MSKPGRNKRGQWLNDDDTGVQALTELAAAVRTACDAIEVVASFSVPAMAALTASRRHLETVAAILPMIDVGTKPRRGEIPESVPLTIDPDDYPVV